MKKIITLLLTLALAGSFTACGGNDDKTSAEQNSPTVEDNAGADTNDTDNNMSSHDDRNDDDDRYEIDENIDAVAEHLGLKNGKETLYQTIGAKAGKEFNGGKVEIYQFDDDSAEYKKLKNGEGDLKIAAHNDGFVLLFTHEKDRDEKMIKKFENIDFK